MTDPTPRQTPEDTGAPIVGEPPPAATRTEPRTDRSIDVREGASDVPPPVGERRSTDAIRREIEDTRADLGETITEIEDRVSPRQIKQRQKARARSRWHRVRESVMGTADDVRGSARGTAEDVRNRVQEAGGESGDRAQEARQKVEGNPLAAGLIAFGGGLLASALLPATKKEQDAAQQLREQVEEPVREGVQEAGQQVKQGLTDQVTERAREVGKEAVGAAARTGSDAQDSAQRVSDDAQQAAQQTRS